MAGSTAKWAGRSSNPAPLHFAKLNSGSGAKASRGCPLSPKKQKRAHIPAARLSVFINSDTGLSNLERRQTDHRQINK